MKAYKQTESMYQRICFLGGKRHFCLALETGPIVSRVKAELPCRTRGSEKKT